MAGSSDDWSIDELDSTEEAREVIRSNWVELRCEEQKTSWLYRQSAALSNLVNTE
jgi:hypothetical protein